MKQYYDLEEHHRFDDGRPNHTSAWIVTGKRYGYLLHQEIP